MAIPDIKAGVMGHFGLSSPLKEFDVADRIVESLKFQGNANPLIAMNNLVESLKFQGDVMTQSYPTLISPILTHLSLT